MERQEIIKSIPFSIPHVLVGMVDYHEGRVVSLAFAETNALSMTPFAFDQGEGLSTHTNSGFAMVQILEGEVSLTIGGKEVRPVRRSDRDARERAPFLEKAQIGPIICYVH